MEALIQEKFITLTQNVLSDENAIARKMEKLHPKLFGLFCPTKYTLVGKRKVYVPYEFLKFAYMLQRGKKRAENPDLKGLFDREGEVGIVFDLNEVHAFHFDLFEELKLEKEKLGVVKSEILPGNCTSDTVLEQCLETIKWQVLRKVFHAIPDVRLVKRQKFYRVAWELELEVRGKHLQKYAYLDNYGTENEHISGLKVRLNI